jgi:CRISPR-associated protein Csm1
VNTILKKDEYTSHVNIVYAGGDDLFAVGRWDKLIDLSIEIRNDFKKFVCDRDDITLSAGIVIVNPKFPIAKAASDAEYAEKMAKDHSFTGMEKNSLNVFGISLNWKEEIPFVIEFKNKLVQWIEKDQLISKGLLMKIFDYYQMYQNGNIEWRWQSAYTMSRYQKIARGSESKNAIEIIKTLLFTGNFNNKISNIRFEAIIASCRWAELLIKK